VAVKVGYLLQELETIAAGVAKCYRLIKIYHIWFRWWEQGAAQVRAPI